MSIIYDALQKTQRNRAGIRDMHQIKIDKRMQLLDRILHAAIVLLIIMVLYAYLPRIYKHLSWAKSAPVVAAKPVHKYPTEIKTNMVLSGVMLSDQNSIAMINNQSYHLGETVDGMKIISIELNRVQLQRGNEYTILRTVS